MIDWKRIDALRDEVGSEALPDIVALFLEETGAAVDALRAMAAGTAPLCPPAGMAARMHFLAGSAGQLGLSDMTRIAAQGERDALAGRDVDPAPVVAAYDEERTALAAGLTERAA